ncbi:hypothetical protein [Methylobacterium sp. NEAU K]|uniref:hypothetical protein n=1 Tax=Methylobacterium sp. NEAU K TaxID=3064946 RepID=UPI0027326B4B|nr:hypothetical protein [Methylobacterium sp. NEAU K]MDP4002160.1 hypothetical protein [Methylobacterium sp. NEAU K]
MTITTSINTVGIVRATEMIQSARTAAAMEHQPGPRTASVEISRSVDAEAQGEEVDRPLPASQRRVVDVRV